MADLEELDWEKEREAAQVWVLSMAKGQRWGVCRGVLLAEGREEQQNKGLYYWLVVARPGSSYDFRDGDWVLLVEGNAKYKKFERDREGGLLEGHPIFFYFSYLQLHSTYGFSFAAIRDGRGRVRGEKRGLQ